MKNIFKLFVVLLMLNGCVGIAVTTSDLTEKTTGTIRNIEQIRGDKALSKAIKKQLKQDIKMFAEINNMRIIGDYKITSFENRVLITGTVSDIRLKNFIYNKIWEFDGIKEVINELNVSLNDNSNWLTDYFLSKSIKNRFLITNGIRSVNYEVVVKNNKAYVLGISYSQEEIKKVGYITATTKGIRDSVIHVITKNDTRRDEI